MNADKKRLSLIALGSPIMDILAEIENEPIIKYNLDYGACVPLTKANEGITKIIESKPDVSYIIGGSVENSARVIGWLIGKDEESKNKSKITMLGSTGKDKYSEILIKNLSKVGVNALFEQREDATTSRCYAAICRTERTLLSDLQASKLISDKFINENMEEILSHEILLTEGYFVIEKPELTKMLIKKFKDNGKIVALTLSSIFIMKKYRTLMNEIMNDCDLIFCNMEECMAFLGEKGETRDENFAMFHLRLTPKKHRLLIVTDGKNGAFTSEYDYAKGHMRFIFRSFPDILKLSEIVDTNGAGDAFLGGYISQWMLGKPITICGRVGNNASGLILKHRGCDFGLDEEIELND